MHTNNTPKIIDKMPILILIGISQKSPSIRTFTFLLISNVITDPIIKMMLPIYIPVTSFTFSLEIFTTDYYFLSLISKKLDYLYTLLLISFVLIITVDLVLVDQ